jgi:hypothetical protein
MMESMGTSGVWSEAITAALSLRHGGPSARIEKVCRPSCPHLEPGKPYFEASRASRRFNLGSSCLVRDIHMMAFYSGIGHWDEWRYW